MSADTRWRIAVARDSLDFEVLYFGTDGSWGDSGSASFWRFREVSEAQSGMAQAGDAALTAGYCRPFWSRFTDGLEERFESPPPCDVCGPDSIADRPCVSCGI